MDSFFFAKNMPRLGSNLQFSSDKSTSQEQPIETVLSEFSDRFILFRSGIGELAANATFEELRLRTRHNVEVR
jgi:hypothetical protein